MKYVLSLLISVILFSCKTQNVPSEYAVIEYEAGACFGFCPIYKMTILPDRTAILEAEHFNFSKGTSKDEFSKPREGTFKTVLIEDDYKKLKVLIDGLHVKNLHEKYGTRNVTDLPTSYLRIKFSDGTEKNVEDYGKKGSEKLIKVYQIFEEMKQNQEWIRMK